MSSAERPAATARALLTEAQRPLNVRRLFAMGEALGRWPQGFDVAQLTEVLADTPGVVALRGSIFGLAEGTAPPAAPPSSGEGRPRRTRAQTEAAQEAPRGRDALLPGAAQLEPAAAEDADPGEGDDEDDGDDGDDGDFPGYGADAPRRAGRGRSGRGSQGAGFELELEDDDGDRRRRRPRSMDLVGARPAAPLTLEEATRLARRGQADRDALRRGLWGRMQAEAAAAAGMSLAGVAEPTPPVARAPTAPSAPPGDRPRATPAQVPPEAPRPLATEPPPVVSAAAAPLAPVAPPPADPAALVKSRLRRRRAGAAPPEAQGAEGSSLDRQPLDPPDPVPGLALERALVVLQEASRRDLLSQVGQASPAGFAQIVRLLLERQGLCEIAVLQQTQRQLALTGLRRDQRLLVVAHQASSALGAATVSAVRGNLAALRVEGAVIITLGGVSPEAGAAAGGPIELLDGEALAAALEAEGIGLMEHPLAIRLVDGAFFAGLD